MQSAKQSDGEENSGMSTKTLVRILVIVGVGIPVLVELVTLSGLITNQLSPGAQEEPDTSAAPLPVVRVGSELLPETPLRATLIETRVVAGSQRWTFELALRARNEAPASYQLRLGPVETKYGTVVADTVARRWEAGETGMLRAKWPLPPGEEPAYLSVEARRTRTADSTTSNVGTVRRRRVQLGKVPVQRGR